MYDKISEQIQLINKRLEKLESAVFNKSDREKDKTSSEIKKYTGAKGGILLLMTKKFLKIRHTASEIEKELEKEGYVYKRQVIQTALNRMSNPKGPLVKIDHQGVKAYVERK